MRLTLLIVLVASFVALSACSSTSGGHVSASPLPTQADVQLKDYPEDNYEFRRKGTGNDAAFYFEDIGEHQDSGSGIYSNNDSSVEWADFNQDIRGRAENPDAPMEMKVQRQGWIKLGVGEEIEVSKKLRDLAPKFDAMVLSFGDDSVTYKMPAEKLEALIDFFDKHEDWDLDAFDFRAFDKTGAFYSTEARIESTQAVKKRLLELLEKADQMENILKIEERLEEVQSRLDRFESTLRDIRLKAGKVDVVIRLE